MKETFPPKLILVMVSTTSIVILTKTIFIYEMSQKHSTSHKKKNSKVGWGHWGCLSIDRPLTHHAHNPGFETRHHVKYSQHSGGSQEGNKFRFPFIHISDLKTSQGHIRPCLKKKETKKSQESSSVAEYS